MLDLPLSRQIAALQTFRLQKRYFLLPNVLNESTCKATKGNGTMGMNRGCLRRNAASAGLVIGLIALGLVPTAAARKATALASSGAIAEFTLGTKWISDFAQGPDGTIWYLGTAGSREQWEGRLGKIGPSGQIDEAPKPEQFPARQISVGSEGDTWFLGRDSKVGRLTPDGAFSEVMIAPGGDFTGAAPASGGGIWLSASRGNFGPDTVDRIDVNGIVTEFPLPQPESRPMDLVEASDGDVWFTEFFGDRIGRLTPSGQLAEFMLPKGSRPFGIAADAHGYIWFTERGTRSIGRIDDVGRVTRFKLPADVFLGDIAAGSDERLWFTEGKLGVLGHITPAGRFREVRLPDRESDAQDVLAGGEGNIWYAAMGEGPCIGGGYTCSMWEPKNPAIIGRISLPPLRAAVRGRRLHVRRGHVKVPLDCLGGKASQRCKGRLTLKRHGKVIGRARYSLSADQRHLFRIRLERSRQPVFGSHWAVRATAIVVGFNGQGARRRVILTREATT